MAAGTPSPTERNGTAALYTYRATDPEGAEVAWSVSGADGEAFTIDRNTGVLTFKQPAGP